MSGAVFVVGDIHGEYARLVGLLQQAGLLTEDLHWGGGAAGLWFLGDFFDRGPDGIGVVDLVMRLQTEAPASGGQVAALLGNHEVVLLSAARFGAQRTGWGATFLAAWRRNGGVQSDLDRLTPRHVEWITRLPAMAAVDGHLLVHADSFLYTRYGQSIAEVNAAFQVILTGADPAAYDRLLDEFSDRRAFFDPQTGAADDGAAFLAGRFLEHFGSLPRLVHGHTPIPSMTGQPPETVTAPFVYAAGRCVNVDAGLHMGAPGFVYRLPALPVW